MTCCRCRRFPADDGADFCVVCQTVEDQVTILDRAMSLMREGRIIDGMRLVTRAIDALRRRAP